MFGSGRARRCISASAASTTASRGDAGTARLTMARSSPARGSPPRYTKWPKPGTRSPRRSEEHTSELQSRQYLVCRLLLEKKKKNELFHLSIQKKKTNKQ